MIDLRKYQDNSVAGIIAAIETGKDPCLTAPTGSGKTVIGNAVIHRLENRMVLWLTHRRELVFQPRDELKKYFDITAGVVLAGQSRNLMQRVQIASVQTLWSRCMRGSDDLPPADIIFVDEAHHVRARTYQKIIESYPNARVVGLRLRHAGVTVGVSATSLTC